MAIRRPILHVTHRPKPVDDSDLSPDAPVDQPRKVIEQAARDMERGNMDTDHGPQTNQTSKSHND
jgi:hypothetical protein